MLVNRGELIEAFGEASVHGQDLFQPYGSWDQICKVKEGQITK